MICMSHCLVYIPRRAFCVNHHVRLGTRTKLHFYTHIPKQISDDNTLCVITLSPAQLTTLQHHAEACYPNEACALIIGRSDANKKITDEVVIVENAWQSDMGHSQRDRYLIAPSDIARVDRAASQHNLDLIGVFHSHPDHPSQPSATDLAQAWPEMSYLIAAVYAGRVTTLQSWVLQDEVFVEETLRSHEP